MSGIVGEKTPHQPLMNTCYTLAGGLAGLHTCLTPANLEQKAAGSGPAAPGALAEAGAAPVCSDVGPGGSLLDHTTACEFCTMSNMQLGNAYKISV